MTATNWPNPVDILDRNSGALVLLFPNNRSFVHLKSTSDAATPIAPGPLGMPMPPGGLPPGIGPQSAPVALGLIVAPPVATWIAMRYGWRQAFVITGTLGLIWIPVWNIIARRSQGSPTPGPSTQNPELSTLDLFRSPRLWALVAANALNMSVYSLWTNWTTLYLVEKHRLALAEANWYAVVPPLVAALGGFGGGWLSLLWMRTGLPAVAARTRVCLVGALLGMPTALIPL